MGIPAGSPESRCVNLKQLEYFMRVSELGSFSKAALILNIAQPALSRQARLLETDLHVTLLTRNGRGVVLTEAGKRLFDHSVGVLQLVARATEDIDATRDEPSGRIVIGLIHNPEPNPTIEVMPVLDEVLGLVGPAASKQGRASKMLPRCRWPNW